jgi:MarR family transcriptional regulator, lower aerobic nicotinate degradation pathway regulator
VTALPLPERAPEPSRDAIADQILALMPRLRRRFDQGFPAELREELSSVTPHQIEALHHLMCSGGMTMNELAQAQHIGLSSATALADRLLRQGLAQRTSDPGDRRVVRLLPTDAAVELVQRAAAAKRRIALSALSALSDEEAATFLALLAKIADAPADHPQALA